MGSERLHEMINTEEAEEEGASPLITAKKGGE